MNRQDCLAYKCDHTLEDGDFGICPTLCECGGTATTPNGKCEGCILGDSINGSWWGMDITTKEVAFSYVDLLNIQNLMLTVSLEAHSEGSHNISRIARELARKAHAQIAEMES